MEMEAQHAKAWGCSEMIPRSKPGSINAYVMREADAKKQMPQWELRGLILKSEIFSSVLNIREYNSCFVKPKKYY